METTGYPKIYLYRRIAEAKLFMDLHYSKLIDLDNIADEASFSKFHFIRLFTKIYGKTPHQYLTGVRIDKAKDLLKKGVSVSDVCMEVGFESVGSFSNLFTKLVGISPLQYMKQQLAFRQSLREKPLNHIPGCFAEARGFYRSQI